MEEKGREQFGDHFRIVAEDHGVIFKLLVYAIRDQENAGRINLNLQKGIMLTGPVGCGKTSLMKLLRFFRVQSETYAIKSCREINFEFIAKGFEVFTNSAQEKAGKPIVSTIWEPNKNSNTMVTSAM